MSNTFRREVTHEVAIPVLQSLVFGAFGTIAGTLLEEHALHTGTELPVLIGGLGCAGVILLNRFTVKDNRPQTLGECWARIKEIKKHAHVFNAGETTLPPIQQVTKIPVRIIDHEGDRGYFPEFDLEPNRILQTAFFVTFHPRGGKVSVNFLKNQAKVMTLTEVKDFQQALASRYLIEKNDRGRAGGEGFRLTRDAKIMFRQLALMYRPTPLDKEAIKRAYCQISPSVQYRYSPAGTATGNSEPQTQGEP
jgi:hypothetical protein